MTTPTMTTTTSATQLAALPRVNLLPREIAEKRRARVIQAGMGGAFAAAAVIVGALYLMAHQSANSAQSDLEAAQAQNVQLRAQVAKFAGDESLRSQRDAQTTMLQTAMGREIQWSHFMNDLSLRVPDNVWVKHITFSESAAPGAPAASSGAAANALPDEGIGKVTFDGVAFTHDDVATWLDSLARQKGYANAYFSSSTTDFIGNSPVVNYSSSVSLTSSALSNRYNKPAGS